MHAVQFGYVVSGTVHGKRDTNVAVIARSNFTLFGEAVDRLCSSDSTVSAYFVGGISSYKFDDIEDIHRLTLGAAEKAKIKMPLAKKFINQGFEQFHQYISNAQDIELLGKARIASKYGDQIPQLLNKIKSKSQQSSHNAGNYIN